jgi:hypothetical protein
MNSYRNAEIEYRERCKARIQRQLEISEEYYILCRVQKTSFLCFHCLYHICLFVSYIII